MMTNNFIPRWIGKYIHYEVWDGIINPLLNVNGYTFEVYELINNFIPHFTGHIITYPYWD